MLCSRAILGGRGSKSGDHEVVWRFMHVPVSEEEPQISWHFRRHPRRARGRRSHYPRDCSRNKGITPFSTPKHTSPPLGLLVGGDMPSWCKYVRMGNGYPGQVGSEQNGAPHDSLPTQTTQAAESIPRSHPRPLGKMASPTIICEPHLQA